MSQGYQPTSRGARLALAMLASLGIHNPSAEDVESTLGEMRAEYLDAIRKGYVRSTPRLQSRFVVIPKMGDLVRDAYVLSERKHAPEADVLAFFFDGRTPERMRVRKSWLELKGAA
jgi:hypothetical protein